MKGRKITVLIIASVIILITALVLGVIGMVLYELTPPDKEKAEKYFQRDKKEIILITEYLNESDYPEIYINESDLEKGTMFIGTTDIRDVTIEDEKVKKAINWLFKRRGYKIIDKTDNTISFTRWTRLMDFGAGIAYSINEKDEPVLQYLTKLEALSEDGWYYYEEDYNEWRVGNKKR